MPDFANYATGVAILIIMLKYLDGREKKWDRKEKEHQKFTEAQARAFEETIKSQSEAFVKTIDGLNKSLDRVAEASERGADEAKERNGHLAELSIAHSENMMVVLETITRKLEAGQEKQVEILKKVRSIGSQHIDEQTVNHQTIQQSEVK